MPTNLEISIGFIESLVGLALVLFAAGTAWGSLKRTVSNIEKTLDRAILPGLEEIRERLTAVERRICRPTQSEPKGSRSGRFARKREKESISL